MSAPGGYLVLGGVCSGGPVCSQGVSGPRGCLLQGGVWSQGVSAPRECGIPVCTEADTPVNRMTNRCKNITLPQTSFAGGKYHLIGNHSVRKL